LGTLTYGDSAVAITFDDRVLAHLQLVIGSKLRRHESFFFSWSEGVDAGGGRGTLWFDSSIPLRFKYSSGASPAINRDWVELLNRSASSNQGMMLLPEPTDGTLSRDAGFSSST
jgi:hypothetical protein